MKLQSIVVGQDGLKGWTGEVALSGVDVFAGPNGAGKSTRLLAVLAGLRGLAESPTDTVREYLGPELPAATVDLQFDTVRISRTLNAGGRTAAAKKSDALVEAHVGAHVARWDLQDFATATAANRQALLDRVCDLSLTGWTVERILEDKLPFAELPKFASTRPDAWLDEAMQWAREEYTRANAAQKRAKADAEARLEDVEADRGLRSPAELDAELRRLDQEEDELREREKQLRVDMRGAEADQDRKELARLREQAASEEPELDFGQDVREQRAMADEEVRRVNRALDDARRRLSRAEGELTAVDAGPCVHCGHHDPHGAGDRLTSLRAAVETAREDVEDLELDAVAAQATAKKLRAREEAARESERLREEIRRFERRLANAPPSPGRDIMQISQEQRGVQQEIRNLQDRRMVLSTERDRAIRSSERERLAQLAVAARDEAVEHFKEISALGKTLKELRARLIADAFRPLEEQANAIVGAVLDAQVVFRSVDDFGVQRGDLYTPWWSLSDGERAVVGAAISYAFARLSGSAWRAVILDGAEAVDGDRLGALLGALAARVAEGDLDNVLVALRADEPPTTPEGVTIHWLGAVESKEAA